VHALLTSYLPPGPLANVLSIAALVTPWRMCLVAGVDSAECPWDGITSLVPDLDGKTLADPHWCYALNVLSLALGFAGNAFLLFNFTNRIRYIIALPFTIALWYAATGIVSLPITQPLRMHS
jgi:potassium channel subfamily K